MGRLFWWDFHNYGFCFGGYILFARDGNLHSIDSHVVGAIVGVSWCWILHGMSGFQWHWLL